MLCNTEDAVKYHCGAFPPKEIDYSIFIGELLGATDALARYDQMLKNMHNNEILRAPLRNREALHPFQDGNGRIERMLITLHLWLEKILSQPYFYISDYFDQHKEESTPKSRTDNLVDNISV